MPRALLPTVVVALAVAALAPARADAQWFGAAYLGASHTQRADVSIATPSRGVDVEFRDVEFAAEPFKSPQYYGLRVGRWLGATRRFGVEIEFIHLKVIAKTENGYVMDGVVTAEPAADRPIAQMSAFVQRYSMTHGLNFLVVNAVLRRPLGDRLAWTTRAGVGPMLPHAESQVLGVVQQQYEYAGVGVQAGSGLEWRFRGPLAALVEYKFTYGAPRITLAEGGEGRMRAATHQIAFGLALSGRD